MPRRSHLVRVSEDELVPSEVGVMHPVTVNVSQAVLIVLFLGGLGVLIWGAVTLGDQAPYNAPDASTDVKGHYTVYYNRAAEPYSGTPTRTLTEVDTADVCTASCDAEAACRFFTYDQTHRRCYFYHQGVLPGQLVTAAVPGPTQFDANVYVKTAQGLVDQLRGVLRDGNQTLFS